jgi:glycerophosphoryl diester phosphodiesterase
MNAKCNPLLDLSARPIIAHRGASGSAPENTIAAFELAVAHGADAIELDVRLTADRVPVVLHDATLDRTTSGRGPLGTLTLEQVRGLDAAVRFPAFRGLGVTVPTLAEVLRATPDIPVLLEIKEPAAQESVERVLREENAIDRCVLASEHHSALARFRESPFAVAASGAEIGALYRAALLRRVPNRVPYRTMSVPLRHRGLTVPTPRFLRAARGLGCPVHVWTVDDPAVAQRLWASGVSGIVTNFPDRIRQSLP